MRHYFVRHEPRAVTWLAFVKSGTGGVLGIGVAGAVASLTGLPFLLAPFGASAVLLFGQPASPLAQPINVVGGYLVACLVTIAVLLVLPAGWWAAALGVGVAIALMLALRVTHPPAGAIPIVASSSAVAWPTLFGVVVAGSVMLVALAVLHHRIPPRHAYPRPAA